jgi:hypothetical protein
MILFHNGRSLKIRNISTLPLDREDKVSPRYNIWLTTLKADYQSFVFIE